MPRITKWKGLRNTTTPDRFKVGELVTAQNLDIDNTERIQTRLGQTLIQNMPGSHSIWSYGNLCLFVCASVLYRLLPDLTTQVIKTLTSDRAMCYEFDSAKTAYFSNGTDTGRVVNGVYSCWGVPVPSSQPVATASGGSMPPGQYLYALTNVRSDGLEGGTGIAGTITLATQGGIQFTSIPVDPNTEVSGKILYISTPNGEVMYRAALMSNATTSYLYQGDTTDLTVPLATQFVTPPPAGHILDVFNGSMYVCKGNLAWRSDPYAFEAFRPASFLQFPGYLTMFMGLNTSVWVSTDQDRVFHIKDDVWMYGHEAIKAQSMEVDAAAAIPGTAVKTTTAILAKQDQTEEGGEQDKQVVMWFSDRGIYVGDENGTATNLTETMMSMPGGQMGGAFVRQLRGYIQYLCTIQGTGTALNAAI